MVQLSVLATKQQPTKSGVCVCLQTQMFQQQGGYQCIVTHSLTFKLHLKYLSFYTLRKTTEVSNISAMTLLSYQGEEGLKTSQSNSHCHCKIITECRF